MDQAAGADRDRARRFRDTALPHLDAAYNFARFCMGDEADAQDAVQECFLLALRHFAGFRGGSMRAWLLAILRNVCHNNLRRRGRREAPLLLPDGASPAEAMWQEPPQTPEAILEHRQDAAAVRRLVASLPSPWRDVIVLREHHGLSYREIAQVCRAPVGTVMSRLARARAMLRAEWIEGASATLADAGPRG